MAMRVLCTYILDKCLKSLGYARALDILCAIFRRVYLYKIHELIRILLLEQRVAQTGVTTATAAAAAVAE